MFRLFSFRNNSFSFFVAVAFFSSAKLMYLMTPNICVNIPKNYSCDVFCLIVCWMVGIFIVLFLCALLTSCEYPLDADDLLWNFGAMAIFIASVWWVYVFSNSVFFFFGCVDLFLLDNKQLITRERDKSICWQGQVHHVRW